MFNVVVMNMMVYNVGCMVGLIIVGFVYLMFGLWMLFVIYVFVLCFMVVCVWLIWIVMVDCLLCMESGLCDVVGYVLFDVFLVCYLLIFVCIGLFVGSYQMFVLLFVDQGFYDVVCFIGVFFVCVGVGLLSVVVLLLLVFGLCMLYWFIVYVLWMVVGVLVVLVVMIDVVGLIFVFYVFGFSFMFVVMLMNVMIQWQCLEYVCGGFVGMYGMVYNGMMLFGYLFVGSVLEVFGV